MASAAPIQSNFNAGELDQRMVGRVDYERLRSSLKVCLNQIPRVTGSLTRRPASYFCDEVRDSTQAARCVKFKYSTLQAYVLEFSDQAIRFKKNGGPIHDLTLTVTNITQANPAVLTYTGTDPANGDHVDVSGVVGMTQVNGRRFKVANVNAGANTFELQDVDGTNVNSSAYTGYSSAGVAERVYQISSPYLAADLFQLAFTQNADTLYIWHPDYNERTLVRASDASWTLATTTRVDGPYLAENTTTTTLTPSAATGTGITIDAGPLGAITGCADNGSGLIRVTDAGHGYSDGIYLHISGVTGTTEANGDWYITVISSSTYDLRGSAFVNAYIAGGATRPAVFATTDVGRQIRMKQGSVWGYVVITAVTDVTQVTADVINTLTSTAAKSVWRLGLWSDTTGYPACGTFYGDRLWRGGTPEQPDRVDGSKVSDYLNMSTTATDGTVTDDNAVARRLNEDDVQAVRWMRGTGNGLILGTLEGEWLISPSTNTEAITPTNIDAKMSTPYGSAQIQPVKAGTSIVFVESGKRRVREAAYQYYDNLLSVMDMTVLAEHITKGDYDPADPGAGLSTAARSGIVELAYQRKTIPVIWAVREDGVLLGNTYSKDEKVTGWHRHILGGWSNAGHTAHAEVESCCVIPVADESYDQLWMVVKRYINGRTVRYNEYLTIPWEQGNAHEDAFFTDCGLTYDGSPATTITGLYHLAGETVQLLVDGATHPDVVVSSTGTITLTEAASVVHVGYSYNSDGECFRFDVGAEDGTSQGKIQRMHKVIFRFYDSLGFASGPSFSDLTDLPFRSAADLMGSPPPLFTGDKDIPWEGDYSTENYICWRFSTTQPGEILAIMPRIQTQDAR